MSAGPALDALQRRLRHWITAPDGVGAALDEQGAAGRAALEALLRGDGRLDAAARLEVYANAYFHRILGALEEDHPALRAALGEAWFHDLVAAYLCVHPPSHPSLRFAGQRLAGFLADDAAAAPFRERFPWAADLARLEWALLDAFDAADAPPLPREALRALPVERWGTLRLRFQPALQLLELGWPVHTLRAARDRGGPLETGIAPRATRVAVWRSEERVYHRPLDADESAALAAMREGGTFGELCENLAERIGEAEAPARAAALLSRWQADGWLGAMAS